MVAADARSMGVLPLSGRLRRALLLSRGDLTVFVERPISAGFVAASALLVAARLFFWLRATRSRKRARMPGLSLPTTAPIAND